MYDTTMTLIGNLVDSPKLRKTKNGHFVASFRVASTPRRYDREQGGWVDGKTLFVTVTCWRALGENVAQSLRKGQPVVVFGRYLQREWEKDEALKTAYELEAIAVGHDLSRGVTQLREGVPAVADDRDRHRRRRHSRRRDRPLPRSRRRVDRRRGRRRDRRGARARARRLTASQRRRPPARAGQAVAVTSGLGHWSMVRRARTCGLRSTEAQTEDG